LMSSFANKYTTERLSSNAMREKIKAIVGEDTHD
jgi:hypothetical protein